MTQMSDLKSNGADIFWRRVRSQRFGRGFFEGFVLGLSAARSTFSLDVAFGNFGTIYVNNQNNQQITTQANQQLAQLQQVEARLKNGSPEDSRNLAGELTRLGVQADTQNPQQLKEQILSRITPAKERLQTQSAAVQSNQRVGLFKNAVKWLLGALISSVLFFTLWRGTDWAR
ncbi:HpsJ family protein [Microcoleus sp. Pol12A6]|uniref:HpsJ family protein n=2 Tax=unclassified Microcoleus TaxID=2642155 RepID=UPI002FD12B39